jgi:hypothetical protein
MIRHAAPRADCSAKAGGGRGSNSGVRASANACVHEARVVS